MTADFPLVPVVSLRPEFQESLRKTCAREGLPVPSRVEADPQLRPATCWSGAAARGGARRRAAPEPGRLFDC